MAASTDPIFPASPVIGIAKLVSPTALTSRADITGTTGLTALTPTSVNGKRIDRITLKAKETTVAGLIFIWIYDGTTSTLFDEITVTAVTPSTTLASFQDYVDYDRLVLPATHRLFVSSTIDQDLDIYAHGGD